MAVRIFGFILIGLGIVLGLYVGVVVMFVGGLINAIEGATAAPVDASQVAWGLARAFLLAELAGGLVVFFVSGAGALIAGVSFGFGRLRIGRARS